MKNLGLAAIIISSSVLAHDIQAPPHLDLEMTTMEYRSHLATLEKKNTKSKNIKMDDPRIANAIKLGTRLSDWINKVNKNRLPEDAIRLTSATSRTGIPIDRPNSYSPTSIHEKMNLALKSTPIEIKNILNSNEELPDYIPTDDKTFIKSARLINGQYQTAARFKSLDRWRSHYIGRAKTDVRGYHYLVSNKITAAELSDVNQLPPEKVEPIKDALIKVCFNNPKMTLPLCTEILEKTFSNNTVAEFYNSYFQAAEQVWKNFFVIPSHAPRKDILWEGSVATVPFNTPSIAKFIPYLQTNIQDEFRWEGWSIKIDFGSFSDGPILVFKPGVVPHVNGLGGNQIVMDSNQPIEEYASEWTIRHEFGHVLGLPDCYHEFYDTKLKAYVNYQLDTTDLMCSRAGNMNERIYLELKKAYDK